MKSIGRCLSVTEHEPVGGRQIAKRWEVWGKEGVVGHAFWDPPRRQYVFYPALGSVFTRNDLDDLGAFLASVTNERKKGPASPSGARQCL